MAKPRQPAAAAVSRIDFEIAGCIDARRRRNRLLAVGNPRTFIMDVHAAASSGQRRLGNTATSRLDRHDRDGVTLESMTPIPLIGSLPGACKLEDNASGPARKPLVRRLGEK